MSILIQKLAEKQKIKKIFEFQISTKNMAVKTIQVVTK